jgi:hypothetical protein
MFLLGSLSQGLTHSGHSNRKYNIKSSVVDRIRIHLFILMRIRSQIQETNQRGSIRILIFSGSWSNFKVTKNCSKSIPTKVKKAFLKGRKPRFTCYFRSIFMLLDPDPHSQNRSRCGFMTAGSGSTTLLIIYKL